VHSYPRSLSESFGACESLNAIPVALEARNASLFQIEHPVPGFANANWAGLLGSEGLESVSGESPIPVGQEEQ
jgi:hypothetical protein